MMKKLFLIFCLLTLANPAYAIEPGKLLWLSDQVILYRDANRFKDFENVIMNWLGLQLSQDGRDVLPPKQLPDLNRFPEVAAAIIEGDVRRGDAITVPYGTRATYVRKYTPLSSIINVNGIDFMTIDLFL